MQLRDDELQKRRVITSDGRDIGEVAGLTFDTETFALTTLSVRLDNDTAREIGAKKPLIGRALLSLPISRVSGIGDAIVLKVDYRELHEEDDESRAKGKTSTKETKDSDKGAAKDKEDAQSRRTSADEGGSRTASGSIEVNVSKHLDDKDR